MSRTVKTLKRLSAVAATAACALAFSTPAHAQANAYLTLLNQGTGKCLAVPHASEANGVGLVQWECKGEADAEQRWQLEHVAGGNGDRYLVRNRNSSKCLAIPGGTSVNGTQAIQWTCNGGSSQIWIHDSRNRLRNLASDRCLAIPNASAANGTKAIQWTCATSLDQRWLW
ncbi:RICIN domain-containing protein [Streptomyces flavofungini]|uniref:RICIN domain-containing protein n=1 Tax=Streptomyces flavofungini TaxID=68200 RepID=UPI0025B1887A|nr:RICIN domain-containing protein [Streptomyces flavofungini]WJV46606.1 RICIN domain-containing protein [Streptomyces flavofungini]